MTRIIPAINCHWGDFECVQEKVRRAEAFTEEVHLDVADGVFTFNRSWGDPKAWHTLKTKLGLEAHLMVEKPEEALDDWLKAGAKRIIFHWETVRDDKARVVFRDTEKLIKFITEKCKKHKAEAVIAVNLETPVEELKPHLRTFPRFHILSVHPGLTGQKFLPAVLEKIESLRAEAPTITISVDGGIIPETAKLAKAAGADILVSGNYIFSSDPKRAYEELVNL